MTNNNKLGNNIRNLLRMFDKKQTSVAMDLGIGTGHMSQIISGKRTPKPEIMEKIAAYFGISCEQLENGEFSGCSLEFDPNRFKDNLEKLLPIITSKEAHENRLFRNIYEAHKIIFDSESLQGLREEDKSKMCENCYDYYFDLSDDKKPVEAWANAMSFCMYLLITGRVIEMIARHADQDKHEQYPALVEKAQENDRMVKNTFERLEESDDIQDDVDCFRDMIQDEEYKEFIDEALQQLKKSDRWCVLADYYLCLLYVFSAVDNHFSYTQNHEFGIELLYRFEAMGNKYARQYLTIMSF